MMLTKKRIKLPYKNICAMWTFIKKLLTIQYVVKSPHGKLKQRNELDLKVKRIKSRELPADTVVLSVERLRDKREACVRKPAIVRFFICSIAFFLL